jgi:hypothetical protein
MYVIFYIIQKFAHHTTYVQSLAFNLTALRLTFLYISIGFSLCHWHFIWHLLYNVLRVCTHFTSCTLRGLVDFISNNKLIYHHVVRMIENKCICVINDEVVVINVCKIFTVKAVRFICKQTLLHCRVMHGEYFAAQCIISCNT